MYVKTKKNIENIGRKVDEPTVQDKIFFFNFRPTNLHATSERNSN